MSYLISDLLTCFLALLSLDFAVELEAPTLDLAPCGRYLAVGSRLGGGAFAFPGAWASLVLWAVAVPLGSPPSWASPMARAFACGSGLRRLRRWPP